MNPGEPVAGPTQTQPYRLQTTVASKQSDRFSIHIFFAILIRLLLRRSNYYCGRDYQTTHWPKQKGNCITIQKKTNALAREKERLLAQPTDKFLPPNLFEEQVGHFLGILETRTYMRHRYAVVEALLQVDTYAAVRAALDNLLETIMWNRSDNMGVRFQILSLFLRLGEDQQCVTFLCGRRSNSWASATLRTLISISTSEARMSLRQWSRLSLEAFNR